MIGLTSLTGMYWQQLIYVEVTINWIVSKVKINEQNCCLWVPKKTAIGAWRTVSRPNHVLLGTDPGLSSVKIGVARAAQKMDGWDQKVIQIRLLPWKIKRKACLKWKPKNMFPSTNPFPNEHVPSKPHVRPHPNSTPKQYHILVTRGWMKTLAIRSDFDFRSSGFTVFIQGFGF